MISKDRFVNTMNRLQELERKLDKADEAFHDLSPGFGGFHIPDVLDITLGILVDVFNDKNDWIDYFVNELDFLKDYRVGCVCDGNDVPIDLSTWDKVYDFLIENMEG